jgi:hypothetical protein
VKTRRLISLIVVPFLFACFPKKPEISLMEVPAAPFVQAFEQRRRSFQSLKAAAAVQAVRKGRKRTYESVGILLHAQNKFRIDAYGPLGQPMLAILWNGKEVLLRLPGEAGALAPKHSGLERLLGVLHGPGEHQHRAERGEAAAQRADERGTPVLPRDEREADERHCEGEGDGLVLHFFTRKTCLKKLMKPPVMPSTAPSIVSHGTSFPSFRSAR